MISLRNIASLLEVVKCQCERRKKYIHLSRPRTTGNSPHPHPPRLKICHVLRGHSVTKCIKEVDSPGYIVTFPLQNEHTSNTKAIHCVCNTNDIKCNSDTKIQPIMYTFNIIGEHQQSAVIQTSSMTDTIMMIKKGPGGGGVRISAIRAQ